MLHFILLLILLFVVSVVNLIIMFVMLEGVLLLSMHLRICMAVRELYYKYKCNSMVIFEAVACTLMFYCTLFLVFCLNSK